MYDYIQEPLQRELSIGSAIEPCCLHLIKCTYLIQFIEQRQNTVLQNIGSIRPHSVLVGEIRCSPLLARSQQRSQGLVGNAPVCKQHPSSCYLHASQSSQFLLFSHLCLYHRDHGPFNFPLDPNVNTLAPDYIVEMLCLWGRGTVDSNFPEVGNNRKHFHVIISASMAARSSCVSLARGLFGLRSLPTHISGSQR